MITINDIVFVQLCKKRPKGIKKTTWVRRQPREDHSIAFLEKIDAIKKRADKINQKLNHYA
jgi:hypothetical protein